MKHPVTINGGEIKTIKENGVADLETSIQLTGLGKCHALILIVGGLSSLAIGFSYALNAYVLPAAKCDLDMKSSEMGIVHAVFLGGGVASCFLWGVMADAFGRRTIILWTLFVDGVLVVLSSISPSFIVFATLRFISGFLTGAPGSLLNSYCAEYFPDKHRSMAICIISFFWNFSWMLFPVVAWGVMSLNFSLHLSFLEYTSWRLLVLMVGLPNIASAMLLFFLLPENPRYLYTCGREKEAIQVLQTMYARNTGNLRENYPVKHLVRTIKDIENYDEHASVHEDRSLKTIFFKMFSQAKELLTPPYLKVTATCSTIFFCNLFGYYGIGMWLPEILNRFESYYKENENGTITVCELAALKYYTNLNETEVINMNITDEVCITEPLDQTVFFNTVIVGAVCCCANFVAVYLTYKVRHYILASASMVLAGICGLLLYVLRSPTQIVLNSAILEALIVIGMIVLNATTINSFPTRMRATGVCICMFVGRMGSVTSGLVFGELIDKYCEIPVFILGGSVVFGGLLAFFLPRNSNKANE